MRKMKIPSALSGHILLVAVIFAGAGASFGQESGSPAAPAASAAAGATGKFPKTLFRDSDGNSITNNEFVDIRMANPSYPDATVVNTLADGTVEFRLQKVPQEGMPAPEFSARNIAGERIAMSALRGKVVVLNFWFIGCPPCMSEMPRLNSLKSQFAGREDVVFLSMTPDRLSSVQRFNEKERFDYTHIAEAEPAMKLFNFTGFPKNIVINKEGKIVYWRTTVKAWEKFATVISHELER